jgi:hypothetical protein
MKPVRPDTEREVEMHFASPLFRDLRGKRVSFRHVAK